MSGHYQGGEGIFLGVFSTKALDPCVLIHIYQSGKKGMCNLKEAATLHHWIQPLK